MVSQPGTKQSRGVIPDGANSPATAPDPTTDLIVETLTEGITRDRGRSVSISRIERHFRKLSSSFRTEHVLVHLAGGEELRVFFKDLDPGHQMEKARRVRDRELEPGLRELRMYREVLSPERHGTLRLYGYRWEPKEGRFWLFLEDGGRFLLQNYSDVTRWVAAARWSARFQDAMRSTDPALLAFLPHRDRGALEQCAHRVARVLPRLGREERGRLERGLELFSSGRDWLLRSPQSVIHGQLFGQNVLLRRGRGEHEVIVIDWETASIGPRLFDLVSLSSGKWKEEERQAMRRAYFDEQRARAAEGATFQEFEEELRAVALYQTLEWLAWWGNNRGLSRDFSRFLHELDLLLADEGRFPFRR